MAIQTRRGQKAKFDPEKLVAGEFATVLDDEEIYGCFAPGKTKRLSTYEDMENHIQQANDGIIKELTTETKAIVDNANKKIEEIEKTKENTESATAIALEAAQKNSDIYEKIKSTDIGALAQNVVDISSSPRNLVVCSGNFYEGKNVSDITIQDGWQVAVKNGYLNCGRSVVETGKGIRFPFSEAIPAGTYTLKIKARGSTSNQSGFRLVLQDTGNTAYGRYFKLSSAYQVFSATVTTTVNSTRMVITSTDFTAVNDYIDIEWAAVYEGEVTEAVWQPSEKDVVQTETKAEVGAGYTGGIRYIRDWLNGSNIGIGSQFVQCQVWSNGADIVAGKVPTANFTPMTGDSYKELSGWTDGSIASGTCIATTSSNVYLQLDLGSIRYDVDYLKIWHHRANSRRYNHWLEVSPDGVTWYRIFDSRVQVAYAETTEGRTHYINKGKVISDIKTVTGDWNNYIDTGFYLGKSLANAPATTNGSDPWLYMTIIKYNDRYTLQMATDFGNKATYKRALSAGIWGAWIRVADANMTASTSAPGIVQLNDNVNSSSTTQAATANALKGVHDYVDAVNKELSSLPKMAHGSVTINAAASTTSNITFSFGATFSSAPKVFVNAHTSAPGTTIPSVTYITTTGATLYIYRSTVAASITVDWFAIGT